MTNRSKICALFIFTILYSGLNQAYGQSQKLYWYNYTVDGDGPTGAYTSLKYDSNGFPHIAYTANADLELGRGVKYASFDGTRWTIEDVDPGGSGRLELALDDQNRPHIVYGSADQSTIKYATKSSDEWVLTPLLTSMSEGQAIYDRDIKTIGNTVHILFTTDNDPRPNTAYSVVHVAVVDGIVGEPFRIKNGIVGKWSSLVIGENNNPAIAFWDNGGDLFFAHYDGNQWNVDNVDDDGYINSQGFYPSLWYANQQYYIAFQSHDPKMLRVASGRPNNWQIEDAADLTGWTLYSTPNPMVRNDKNQIFIAHYDIDNADLLLSTKEGNAWSTTFVDTVGRVGQHASMALNAEGLPAITYYDETNGYLQFAYSSTTEAEDRDADLLPDYIELISGLSPFDADFDDDGLRDGEEDVNQNGFVDPGETDPKEFDTDGDGLSDGLESGRTSGVPGATGILGTDMNQFVADADPSTQTNPTKFDSDDDGLGDGIEDGNQNGVMEQTETDPLNADTDGDGLNDYGEVRLYTSPFDLDTDNDGIMDGDEDANGNHITDENETSPLFFDTDNDGLSDGLELGLTGGINDPDGGGRLKGTNMDTFVGDLDPASQTNPLKADSDDDTIPDSDEDVNKNGRVDAGETDPAKWDTDGDGAGDGEELRFGTDPLNPNDGVSIETLFVESFSEPNIPAWHVVDDGDIEGPSNWLVYQNALYQLSNIHDAAGGFDPESNCMLGSHIWAGDKQWQDYVISFKMRTDDDDGVGIIFRYTDEKTYYRISMSKELGKIWCTRFQNGVCEIINEVSFDYELGRWYNVRLYAIGSDFSLQLDGETVFTANDGALKHGAFGFYSWKNSGVGFSNVDVVKLKSTSVESKASGQIVKDFALMPAYPNPFSKSTNILFLAQRDAVVNFEIYNILGQLVYNEPEKDIARGSQSLLWDGMDHYNRNVPNGVYLLRVIVYDRSGNERIKKSYLQKVVLAR